MAKTKQQLTELVDKCLMALILNGPKNLNDCLSFRGLREIRQSLQHDDCNVEELYVHTKNHISRMAILEEYND